MQADKMQPAKQAIKPVVWKRTSQDRFATVVFYYTDTLKEIFIKSADFL